MSKGGFNFYKKNILGFSSSQPPSPNPHAFPPTNLSIQLKIKKNKFLNLNEVCPSHTQF